MGSCWSIGGLTPELKRTTKWHGLNELLAVVDVLERSAYAKRATSALSMLEVSAGNSDFDQKPTPR